MFGAAKKLLGNLTSAFDSLANEEELKAVVSACVLVAGADNNIEESEKEAAFKVISAHPSLTSFKAATIRKYFDNDVSLLNADRQLAEEALFDNVRNIKERISRIRVLGIANEIARADGTISKEEQAVINKIRSVTG